MNIRPTEANDKTKLPAPGQFYSLDFGDGGATYKCSWGSCLNQCKGADVATITCGSNYPVETGNMVGPLKKGIADLLADPPDTWIPGTSPDKFQTTAGQSSTSQQLVIAPVWDDCDPSNQIKSGTSGQKVKVLGFIQLFVDQINNKPTATCTLGAQKDSSGGKDWVEAHLVNQISCGTSTGTIAGSTATGPYGVPIRLVKTP